MTGDAIVLHGRVCAKNERIAKSENAEQLASIVVYFLGKEMDELPMVDSYESLIGLVEVSFDLLYSGGYDDKDPTHLYDERKPDDMLYSLLAFMKRLESVTNIITDFDMLFCVVQDLGGLYYAADATTEQIIEAIDQSVYVEQSV